MAVDMFLKLDGIDGESIDKTHAKSMDILAWSWGWRGQGERTGFVLYEVHRQGIPLVDHGLRIRQAYSQGDIDGAQSRHDAA